MRYLYTFLLTIADACLPLAALLLRKGKTHSFVAGRIAQREISLPEKIGQRIWIHCASLGEFEQVKPIIESIKHQQNCQIVISFFSPSGYQYSQNYPFVDAVFYLPFDTPRNAERFIKAVNPDKVVFVKYEFWFHFLTELFAKDIPVYLVSAVFRPNQFLFSKFGKWLFKLLPKYKTIFVQDKNSLDCLISHGINNAILSGDTRYDKVYSTSLNVKSNPIIEAFKGESTLLILGSSWSAEEDLLLYYLSKRNEVDLKILIAPHDISQGHVNEILQKFKDFTPLLYSKLKPSDSMSQVMVLDTIGHLASAYYYGNVALVGGAFGKGLHNILEPIAFGVPVIFGPHTQKYPEAQLAINNQIAIQVNTTEEFVNALEGLMKNPPQQACLEFIKSNKGASEIVVKELLNLKQ
jgi:3-deoxy-D-manno-octulosonic-acid transferase